MEKKVKKAKAQWEKTLWHLSNQEFACQSDAEHVLRRQLQASSQTVPNQVNKPTDRPTMRWIFQCFEGIDLLHIRMGSRWQTQVLGLQPLHQRVLRLLGPAFCQFYFFSP